MPRSRDPKVGRPTADSCRQVTIRQLPPLGGHTGLQWAEAETTVAFVTLAHAEDYVMLGYRWQDAGARWRSTRQRITLVWDNRHFGGAQCYFVCPNCARWAWKLYDPGTGQFACRHCGKLTYQSQREGSSVRALRRATKIRRYLGGSGDISDPFPPRPAKMTLRIYECLRQEARQLETLPPEAWLQAATKNIRLGYPPERGGSITQAVVAIAKRLGQAGKCAPLSGRGEWSPKRRAGRRG